MKTQYHFIHFEEGQSLLPQHERQYLCKNNKSKSTLGIVSYYPLWEMWCFSPSSGCIFSVSCMNDIIHFIGQLP